MIEYAHPAPIRILVTTLDMDKAVKRVIKFAMQIISKVPPRPTLPTTNPKRKYIITPKILKRHGMKTPSNVEKRFGGIILYLQIATRDMYISKL